MPRSPIRAGRAFVCAVVALLLVTPQLADAERARRAAIKSAPDRSGPALFSRRHAPGSPAAHLKRLLRMRGMRPRTERADHESNRAFANEFLASQRAGGAVTWRSQVARRTIDNLWARLAPSLRNRYGVALRRNLVLLRDADAAPNAYALSDGRVVFYESYWQLCNSVAAAVSAAEGQPNAALARNLREVARRAKAGEYSVTFPGANRRTRLYRSALEGSLSSVLAHELGHVALGHAADDVVVPATSPGRDAINQARRYLGRQKGVNAERIEESRLDLVSQRNEYDADFVGIDAALAAGVSPVGFVAEQVVSALMERKTPSTLAASHPPLRDRLRATRDRIHQHKQRFDADTLATVDALVSVVLGKAATGS